MGADENLSDILANRTRSWFAQIEFFEREVGVHPSNTFEQDIAAGRVDMIDRHRGFAMIDHNNLLKSIRKDNAGHHRIACRGDLSRGNGTVHRMLRDRLCLVAPIP